jgi:WD40 repeat protein
LIQLDFCVYEIFELSVLNEYELYIRNYGSSNCIQTFTQTNNEIASQESQTDELIISEKWSQCPPHLLLESGDSINGSLVKLDSFLLSDFIVKSANAIECLLDEEKEFEIDEIEDFETKLHFKKNILIPEYLIGHEIVDLIVLPNSKKKIIVCWSSEAFEDIEGCKSILLLIDLQHEKVQVYMKCLARVTTLNCSEARPNLLFAGTENGSIQLWDLNESEKDHTFSTKGMVKRWPSFITDSIVGTDYGHCSPIIRIHQRPSNDNKFQLITIEQLGYCQSWVFWIIYFRLFYHSVDLIQDNQSVQIIKW